MPLSKLLPETPTARDAAADRRPVWAHEHAANDSFSIPRPATGQPGRQHPPETPRLAGAFLASLMLHFGLAVLVTSTLTYTAVSDNAGSPLNVTLAQAPARAAQLAEAPAFTAPRDHPGATRTQQKTLDLPQQPARFLVDPDLSVLEEIPATFPGTVSLSLSVTAQGTVERVKVIRADPVPKELLDGLVERFAKAKLSPATVGSQATASTINITIRVDPPAQLFEPVR